MDDIGRAIDVQMADALADDAGSAVVGSFPPTGTGISSPAGDHFAPTPEIVGTSVGLGGTTLRY